MTENLNTTIHAYSNHATAARNFEFRVFDFGLIGTETGTNKKEDEFIRYRQEGKNLGDN